MLSTQGIREDVDRLMERLTNTRQPPSFEAVPYESDGDEFVISPTPPHREPLRASRQMSTHPLCPPTLPCNPPLQP